jgi:hypothetical protein
MRVTQASPGVRDMPIDPSGFLRSPEKTASGASSALMAAASGTVSAFMKLSIVAMIGAFSAGFCIWLCAAAGPAKARTPRAAVTPSFTAAR